MATLNAANPIVEENGTMTQQFRTFMLGVGTAPIIGTGSPEGAVEALQYSEYIDSTGISGSIKYIKMQAEIGGDRSKGWVLI